jgi:tetratricopeptide (TPR) repeat protein
LLAARPEAAAWHASAAGDWDVALTAWLDAAEQAAARYANRDAERLLTRALDAGQRIDDLVGIARARLARARVREVLADYRGAMHDLEQAADLARASARPDLEAAALRELGGDVIVGLGWPSTDCLPYLEVGVVVAQAEQLGRVEVELMGRLAVVWSTRARFDLAEGFADRALARARELDDARAVALALDAVKNVSAYTGALERLDKAIPELEGLLRPAGDLALLQWCVFESVVTPLAHARWGTANLLLDRALALNRRTGHPWGSLFLAQRSWLRRAQGDYGQAISDARTARSADVSADHPWWTSFADTMLGWVLSDMGVHDEAVEHLQAGVSDAERDGMEAFLLRDVCHLALAYWRRGDLDDADEAVRWAEGLLAGVRTPPGRAFLHAAHAYAAVARVRLARGEIDDALRLLEVVRAPAEAVGWREIVATDRLLRGRASMLRDEPERARAGLTDAATMAEADALVPIAWEARTALATLGDAEGDPAEAERQDAAATRHLDVLAGSLDDPDLRAALRRAAAQRRATRSGEASA